MEAETGFEIHDLENVCRIPFGLLNFTDSHVTWFGKELIEKAPSWEKGKNNFSPGFPE